MTSHDPNRHRPWYLLRLRTLGIQAGVAVGSALLGWLVNYEMGHSRPHLSTQEIEFYYSFPSPRDSDYSSTFLRFDDPIVAAYNASAWREFEIGPTVPLRAFRQAISPSFPNRLERSATALEQNFALLDRVLSTDPVDVNTLAALVNQNVEQEYTFEVLELLVSQGKVSMGMTLDQATRIINANIVSDAGLPLAPTFFWNYAGDYGLTWLRQSHVKRVVFPVIALILQRRFADLRGVVRRATPFISQLRRDGSAFLAAVLDKTRPFLPKYRRMRIVILANNEGSYPVEVTPAAVIDVSGPTRNSGFRLPATVTLTTSDTSARSSTNPTPPSWQSFFRRALALNCR